MRSNKPKSAAPAGRSNIATIQRKFKNDQYVPQSKKNEK